LKGKQTTARRYKKKEEAGFKYNHEIIGILLLSAGVLISLSMYYEKSVGIFGHFVKSLLLGLMGGTAFLVPPLILFYGFLIVLKKDDRVNKFRLLYTSILMLVLSALTHTVLYDESIYENLTIFKSLSIFYKRGTILESGGVIGGLLSMPFLSLFQVVGTIIILSTIALITIILLTNISVIEIIKKALGYISTKFKRTVNNQYDTKKDDKKLKGDKGPINEDTGVDIPIDFKHGADQIAIKFDNAAKEIKEKDGIFDKVFEEEKGIGESETIEFIMKDVKKKRAKEIEALKGTLNNDTVVQTRQGIHYTYPSFDLLNDYTDDGRNVKTLRSAAIDGARKLEETLKSFGVEAKVINVSRGPTVTRYELHPSPGVKVSRIVNLADDISLNLASSGIRIEAPIPGKAAIGIEVANKEVTPVLLREVIENVEFMEYPSKLAFAVGKDISGETIVANIAKMPHLLIAGATGAGKSVCINSMIMSLLYKASPDEVKLLMVDPKVVELGIYNGIPHLLIPVVTDPRKAAGALNWAVQEMVNRYKLFAEKGVRDIKGYNAMLKESGEQSGMPHIVIIIDELADLMMVAPGDVEDAICRLAQMARAAGMHLVIATQRPSVDVITGVIKANIPSRISFAVSSQVDSRTILDMAGAEKLLGKGDMLFYPIGKPKPIRVQGAFVSDKEVEKVVDFIKAQGSTEYDENIIEEINSESEPAEANPGDNDELLPQAIELVVGAGQASVSLMQRRFKVGYARAARIVDQMEARGIVGPFEGSKPRQVLISKQQWQELQMAENE
jgi:DNA segregation ATPase FtsK/SpoIIIE, S-DNA-T family